jgi:2-oxoglutarate ferredoxin oxidoreductase subunit alpha
MNLGQLVRLIRGDFLVDAKGLNKMRGKPFRAEEIEDAILELFLHPTQSPDTKVSTSS